MSNPFLFWLIYVLICSGTIVGNFLYSWFIERTRIYRPELDANARASRLLFEQESADKIAFAVFYLFFYAVIVAPLVEEFIFREWIFGGWLGAGFWIAAFLSSFIWAVLHIDWYVIPYIFVTGLVLSYIWVTYGLIWCVLFHATNNAIAVFWGLYKELHRISEKETIAIF